VFEVINRKTNEYKALQELLEVTKKEKQDLQTNIKTQNSNIENLNKNINEDKKKYDKLTNE
jgi:peptidoglycan hydrolase CwlO-like protein